MSSRPSAPPFGAAAGGGGAAPPAATCDVGLYADLLRRANGDQALVALWLAEMGFRADPSTASAAQALIAAERSRGLREQYSTSSDGGGIKAVPPASAGSRGGAAGAGGSGGVLDSAWSSLAAVRGSPVKLDPLRSTPGATHGSNDGDLDSRAAAAGAPRHFFCPISLQLMRDPVVVAATGQTYDRPCIERWLSQGNRSCPATGQSLAEPVQLVPNVALRNSIEEWAEKHAPWLLDRQRRVKPVPKEDQFGTIAPSAGAAGDPDLALAIRLQQEELERLASQRRAAALGAGGAAAAGAALGGQASRPGMAGAASARRGPSRQQLAPQGAPPAGYPVPPAAAQPAGRASCLNMTTLLLLATTVAWITLYIVSLADNGWNLGDLSLNPWAGPDQSSLLAVGAQEASLVTVGGQWWRLFSSPFVNAGVIQLLLNMSVLWTLGRHLEGALAQQLPAASLGGIFLAGSWVGALASANLNKYYVTCGASAGVCALLGATWADQLLWRKRYVNQLWTVLVLLAITAIFVVMSLLPLVDPWYMCSALLTGFFALPVPSLAPRVRRGQRGARRWLAVQCVCACLVIAAATLGTVGVVTKADVGSSSFLQDGSCVTFGRWQCLPAGASPNGCRVEAQDGSEALLLRCPSGIVSQLPNGTAITPGDTDLITQICFQYCALSGGVAGGGSPPPPPAALPVGGGTGTGGGTNSTAPAAGSCGNTTVGVSGPVLC
ncbi:hypothetical protein ABPG75_010441 [Micractinium tetrahymenae]